ncbi:MAG: VanZ family protein [Armatimonadota bacterium]|nr:VanZ family protein [Armatimonadota bacterium]
MRSEKRGVVENNTSHRIIRFLWLWLPVIIVMLAIMFVSAIPSDKKPGDPFQHADKCAHFMAYGILALTLYRAIRLSVPGRSRAYHAFMTIVVAALYGITDEGHQHFVPGRSMSPYDLMADTIGASIAAVVMNLTRMIGGR